MPFCMLTILEAFFICVISIGASERSLMGVNRAKLAYRNVEPVMALISIIEHKIICSA